MQRFARLVYRGRWVALAVLVGLFALSVWGGLGVSKRLVPGGFEDPASESSRADAELDRHFGLGLPDVVLLLRARAGGPTGPAFAAEAERALAGFRGRPGVLRVASPVGPRPDALLSADGRLMVVTLQLRGSDTEKQERFAALAPELRARLPGVLIGGVVPAGLEAEQIASQDLARAEWITLPLLAVALVLLFRSPLAALLPLLVGGFSILGALASLRVLSHLTDISLFAMNIVTFIGLGLAVDYSLFLLARYREERAAGHDVEDALVRSLSTAGRTVLFSGIAVATSLLGLLVFPVLLLRSVALGGALVVLVTLLAGLVLLPALLAVTDRHLDRFALRFSRRSAPRPPRARPPRGLVGRVAALVLRAPGPVVLLLGLALLVLATPVLRMNAATSDSRVLPKGAEVRRVQEALETPGQFPPNELSPVLLLVETPAEVLTPAGVGALYDYVEKLRAVPGVRRVDSLVSALPDASKALLQTLVLAASRLPAEQRRQLARAAQGRYAVVAVFSAHGALSPEAETQLDAIRGIRVPGVRALAAGETARLVDLRQSIQSRLPLALGLVCLATVLGLLLALGALLVPLKAVLVNLLSLGVSFGALVFIFQDGRLEGLLGYQSSGYVDLTIPVVIFAVLFGLAMDYELFLLSRIREAQAGSGDPRAAVAVGLERSARLVVGAAAVMALVMIGFSSAELLLIKQLGVSMAIAIAIDATVIRGLLVPAIMILLGRAAWWSPAPLGRLWKRLGLGLTE